MTDLDFSITEIDSERTDPHRSVPDGCDTCMHCRLMRTFYQNQSDAPSASSPHTASTAPSEPSRRPEPTGGAT